MIIIYIVVMTILKYYSYVVIANVVLSWLVAFNVINTGNRFVYSVLDFTYRMTEPFLNRIRALILFKKGSVMRYVKSKTE